MPSATYGECWRAVRAHVPQAPVGLCQYWVNKAFESISHDRSWSWLRGEGEILTDDAKTDGTVSLTRGDATVTGSGTTFASTDVGRQFKVSTNSPVYSIQSYTSATSIELDRVYGGTTVTGSAYTILDAYITMPTDFRMFKAVLDVNNNWRLRIYMTDDELNKHDAQRSSTGTPWGLFSRRLSTLTATEGQIQYELYPYTTVAKNYPYFYIKYATPFTSDEDTLPFILSPQTLITSALAEAYAWPGPDPTKKPQSYQLELSNLKRKEAEDDIFRTEVLDEDIYLTWWETVSDINSWPMAPLDAKWMQSHDMDLARTWVG